MGCDGGTIPRRSELWRYCNLTQQPLQRPIVACDMGKLYNKTAIIEAIINRESPPHIRTLKDVITLNLTPNSEFRENGSDQIDVSPYICPVTGLEMTGKYRFVALWSCGCVFSERALKEIGVTNCPKCQKEFDKADVVVLNGSKEEVETRKKRKSDGRRKPRTKKVKVGENLQ